MTFATGETMENDWIAWRILSSLIAAIELYYSFEVVSCKESKVLGPTCQKQSKVVILSKNSCHFVNLLIFDNSYFLLSLR